jgi:hypothetical protein
VSCSGVSSNGSVEDLRGGRVDQDDAALVVHAHDALGGGAQDHLGLPLLPGQLGLGVQGAAEVTDHQHQQLVAGVVRVSPRGVPVVGPCRLERGGVRRPAVLHVGAGHLDRELAAVGPPRNHPRRLRTCLALVLVRPPHRSGDAVRVELRKEIEQPAPHQCGPRGLEGLQGDGVGVDDGAVAVHQEQRIGQRVEYGGETSSASGWPAAHDGASSLLPLVPVAGRPTGLTSAVSPPVTPGASPQSLRGRWPPQAADTRRRREGSVCGMSPTGELRVEKAWLGRISRGPGELAPAGPSGTSHIRCCGRNGH